MAESSERRTRLLALALVLVATIAVACADDDDSSDSSDNGLPQTDTAADGSATGPPGGGGSAGETEGTEEDEPPTGGGDDDTTTGTTAGGGSATAAPPMVAVTGVSIVRAIPGYVSCELDVEVENQGPGTAENVEVTATVENLRGEGAPDHYTVSDTLDGPDQLAEGSQDTYWMTPSVPMEPGDVWIYTGAVTVAGQVVFEFGNSSSSARQCEE
jgi:hypothetical protein